MEVPIIAAMLARLLGITGAGKPKGQPLWRQGDVFIMGVDAIPAQAHHSPLPHGILVRGELTGHSHRLENPQSGMLFSGAREIGELFLDVPSGGTRIIHEEHGPIELPQGCYRVWRQREYTPKAIVVVRD